MTVQLRTSYEDARAALTSALRQSPALARLADEEGQNWITAVCNAWSALAEVISFYQGRVIDEGFLPTAEQIASLELIYHSLGHAFPPNATATTTLAYHLSANVAGVEAVSRTGTAGGTGMSQQTVAQLGSGPASTASQAGAAAGTATSLPGVQSVGTPAGVTPGGADAAGSAMSLGTSTSVPGAAQVRAVPSASGKAPVFVTLSPLGAFVGASRLAVSAQATTAPPALGSETILVELAGTRTGVAVGQPILIVAEPPGGGEALRWIRIVTAVRANAKRGSTLIEWEQPLGIVPGEPPAAGASNPVVFGFAASSALAGAAAPDWTAQPIARQLAAMTNAGQPIPMRGGLAATADGGTTWTLSTAGLPAGVELTAVGVYGDVVIVSAGASGLQRSVAGAPFTPTTIGGGSRRPVGFLGGTADRMLAGATAGVVYESWDQGQTWSAVTGGPPQLSTGDPPQQILVNQLPSTTVGCVVTDPGAADGDPSALLAGTGAGVYVYSGASWQPLGNLQTAVFALTQCDGTWYAATSDGVYVLGSTGSPPEPSWSQSLSSDLAGAAYALAEVAGSLYAATSRGVWVNVADTLDTWRAASDGLPSAAKLNALLADGNGLLAATDQGIYRATGADATLSWSRCDHAPAFTIPAAAIPNTTVPAGGAPPGPDLVTAFADYGVELDAVARLTPATAGLLLSDPGHTYGLAPTDATEPAGAPWQVTLLDAMPVANGLASSNLADSAGGPMLAVGSAATPIANQWPGFAVAGSAVEITPPVRNAVPGLPAIIEQRGPTPSAAVLDVIAVDQDSGLRAGKATQLTRLHSSQTLTPDAFPRRSSTVWTGAAILPRFDPPTATVQRLSGSQIELAAPLSAPVTAGQPVAVTGSAPGLAVAPLGGAIRVAPDSTQPQQIGPPQADMLAVAIGSDATVYLASAEGVFTVAPETSGVTGTSVPRLLANGWPGGGSPGVTVAGANVIAGSQHGIYHLAPGAGAADPSWSPVGSGGSVVALAGDGTGAVVAFADGSVLHAASAAEQPSSWTGLPKLTPAPTTLAISGSTIYAANPSGVFALSDGAWKGLGEGAVAGPDTCLQIDGSGTLWAGTPAGLQSYDPGTGQWAREPQWVHSADSLCLRPNGAMLGARSSAVGEREGTEWNPVATAPGATPAGMAAGADGSIWLAARASLTLTPTSGLGSLQLSYAPVLTGAAAGPGDLALLGQGVLSDGLLAVLADAGATIDPSHAVTSSQQQYCWLIRSGNDLYLAVQRSGATGTTLDVYHNQTILYPTAPPVGGTGPTSAAALEAAGSNQNVNLTALRAAEAGTAQTCTVLAGGTLATLTVPASAVVWLPADADAPSFGETATIAAPTAEAQASAKTLGPTSTLSLSEPLTYLYDASTVQVNLNVVPAAAGQVVSVPIGNGDPQQAHQSFRIANPVAAIGTPDAPVATPQTSLNVYVDGSPWTRVSSLTQAGPTDDVFVQSQNADGSVTISFGDGNHGALLPAGTNNIFATYLKGGGPDTEVAPGAVLQALDRPQLVTAVHNPLPALLPTLPDPDQARRAAVRRLDRTVTVEDYEDLACSQIGVSCARVDVLGGPLGRAIVITVALQDNPPDGTLEAVAAAIGELSPTGLRVRVLAAQSVDVLLTIQIASAQPAVAIEPAVRTALSGLPARKPGDPLYAAEVLSTATAVPGVIAAQILSWERVAKTPGTDSSLAASSASWPVASGAPTAAELLRINGDASMLTIDVVKPAR